MSEQQDPAANAAQIDYWNDRAGLTWAQLQAQLDRQLEPLGREALRVLSPSPGERVLDVGCGCGQTSLELAAITGPQGAVVGVDISRPMLQVARTRSAGVAGVSFREADAQADDLGRGRFDAIYSRFGVMFFADPAVAFANLRAALRPGGRLAFVCWRPLAENDWMRAPMEAAAAFFPPLPPSDPLAPGPFAFAEPERVRGVLSRAGFSGVDITPYDALIGGGDLEQAVELAQRVGPLGSALREYPDSAGAATAAVRRGLEAYVADQGVVMMPAAVWIVTATSP